MRTRFLDIPQKIRAFHGTLAHDPHHRYRSWEHCYSFFRKIDPAAIITHRDEAALHLGFYLASWGMYRGSGFLLQHSYTIHLKVVECLGSPSFSPLWANDFGSNPKDSELMPIVFAAIKAIKDAYSEVGKPTDTLVTKILLGTFGCLPACDRYFIDGFKRSRLQYSSVNAEFVRRVLKVCDDNSRALRSEQLRIESVTGIHYPMMKLVDMYFWQIGYDHRKKKNA